MSKILACFCKFFNKSNEKSMPKGIPTVDLLDPFSDTGPPRVDLLFFLIVSVRCQKNIFFDQAQIVQISKKLPKGRWKDDGTVRPISRGHGLGGLGPVSGHARDKACFLEPCGKLENRDGQ